MTIVKFIRDWYPIREAYHSDNSSGVDRSGEYVPLAEYLQLKAASQDTVQVYDTEVAKLKALIQRVVDSNIYDKPNLEGKLKEVLK